MNKKETTEMPLLNDNHRRNLARGLCVAYQNIKKLDNGKPEELEFDLGNESITTVADEVFFKAVKAGAYGVCRELYQAGESDLAKQALEIARNAKI